MKFFKKLFFRFNQASCQRKHLRKSIHFAVKCKERTDRFKFAFVKNISIGGLLLETAEQFTENSLLKIQFPFLILRGKIVHTQKTGTNGFLYGIEFSEVNADHKDILSRFFQLT